MLRLPVPKRPALGSRRAAAPGLGRSRRFQGTSAAFVAVGLSLLIAGQAAAATWGNPFELTFSFTVTSDLVGLGNGRAVVAYSDDGYDVVRILARRTTDAGATWSSPHHIDEGFFPVVAGRGMEVDVVYNAIDGRVWYAHSGDAGVSWDLPIPISPAGRSALRPAVARGPDGVVVVVWEDDQNGNVKARVSHDGGDTFDAADLLTRQGSGWGVAAAIGEHVIYVAYSVGDDDLRVRRSLNEGGTWQAHTEIANHQFSPWWGQPRDGVSMTAIGGHAYVAYVVPNGGSESGKVRYRRTVDSGALWSAPIDLSPASWSAYDPDIALNRGVLRAAFTRCTSDGVDACHGERAVFRQSTNGTSWCATERIDPGYEGFDARDPQVAYSQRTMASYQHEDIGLFVRFRNP